MTLVCCNGMGISKDCGWDFLAHVLTAEHGRLTAGFIFLNIKKITLEKYKYIRKKPRTWDDLISTTKSKCPWSSTSLFVPIHIAQ